MKAHSGQRRLGNACWSAIHPTCLWGGAASNPPDKLMCEDPRSRDDDLFDFCCWSCHSGPLLSVEECGQQEKYGEGKTKRTRGVFSVLDRQDPSPYGAQASVWCPIRGNPSLAPPTPFHTPLSLLSCICGISPGNFLERAAGGARGEWDGRLFRVGQVYDLQPPPSLASIQLEHALP